MKSNSNGAAASVQPQAPTLAAGFSFHVLFCFFLLVPSLFISSHANHLTTSHYQWFKQDNLHQFSFSWRTPRQEERQIEFQLSGNLILNQPEITRTLHAKRLQKMLVPLLYDYAKQQGWYQMEISLSSKGYIQYNPHVGIEKTHTERIRAMSQQEISLKASIFQAHFLKERSMPPFKQVVLYDHPKLVSAQRELLAPLARAFFQQFEGESPRVFVQEIAYFIQSLSLSNQQNRQALAKRPYQTAFDLLKNQAGNAESKVVLMAAILRNLMPNIVMAIAYTPNHSFLALAIHAEESDLTVNFNHKLLVVIDPSGIMPLSVGQLAQTQALYVENEQLTLVALD